MDSFFGLNPYYRGPQPAEEQEVVRHEYLSIVATRNKISGFPEIGRGGEAVVYRLKDDTAAKVFLEPTDPQFAEDPALQVAAKERIAVMQTKLFDLPHNLPKSIVMPNGILVDADKKIFGYTMPLISSSKTLAEIKKGDAKGLNIILQLYDTLIALHENNTVIGDFNENNILVDPVRGVKVVDADSMQFGSYICTTFVPRFTPPECLKNSYGNLVLTSKRTEMADWYALLVMAMRMLTNTDPYGGTIKGMTLSARIENRITVFDRRVIYPVTAVPLRSLPRDLLEIFFQAFHRGVRFIPARSAFEGKHSPSSRPSTSVSSRKVKKMRALAFKEQIAREWLKGRQFGSTNKLATAISSFTRNVRSSDPA